MNKLNKKPMTKKKTIILNASIIIISLLVSILSYKSFKIVAKKWDNSYEAVKIITEKLYSFFNPYGYMEFDNYNYTDIIIELFLPTFKKAYTQIALSNGVLPEEYLEYYNAILCSESTGEAREYLQTETDVIINNTVQKSLSETLPLLKDYSTLINNYYTVDRTTYADDKTINIDTLMSFNNKIDKGRDIIYIYHTHSQEAFSDSKENDPDTSIIAVGETLAQILREDYGYQVIHNKTVYDLVDGMLDRSKAYLYAEKDLDKLVKTNKNVKVIIDLHRDGIDGEKMTTEINGQSTARLMFLNGLSRTYEQGEIDYLYNPNMSANLAFSFQTQLMANELYPGLMRHIYLKGYEYNLHYLPRSMLIEAGSQKNTLQEVLNAMKPLATVLDNILSQDIKKE